MHRKNSIGFSGFEKLGFLMKISQKLKNLENLKKHRGKRSCFASYPSGNQVDDSPLVAVFFLREEQFGNNGEADQFGTHEKWYD